MSDVVLIVTVLVIAIGGLVGVAYLLDRRRKARGVIGPQLPALGPVGRVLLWVIRGLLVIMVLAIIIGIALRTTIPIWVAFGCLLAFGLMRSAFQIVRATGK